MIPIRDTAPCHNKPFVTWGIIAVCTLVYATMMLLPDHVSFRLLHLYGMVPARYADGAGTEWPFDGYLSFATNLFIHATWLHLLMNVWFLWIFADNIEDRMGRLPFFVFYLLCGIIATWLQWHFDPTLTIPVVGASGSIAGVLGAYYFLYPLARVVVLFPPLVFSIPAIAFLGLWILWQLYNATTTLLFAQVSADIAWWAHLGGFLAGSLLHPLFLRKP